MSVWNAFVSKFKQVSSDVYQYSVRQLYWRAKSSHQQRIEKFMKGAGQFLPFVPTKPDQETLLLRARLITEEWLETMQAMGFKLSFKTNPTNSLAAVDDISFAYWDKQFDMVGVVDGIADLSVVSVGTLSAMGVADAAVLEIVDKNNISKLNGGYRGAHGKFIKPPNHKAPDIANVLKEQGYNQ